MSVLENPFFWAVVSMLGLEAATLVVSGARIGKNLAFVSSALVLVTAGRVLLVLPFCDQPRLETSWWTSGLGGAILATAFVVGAPALSIRWWRPPAASMPLRTEGVYGIVRHPIYLCEVLWPIGWSLLWGSIYGLLLTPVWWLGFLFHALVEEGELQRVLGSRYEEYKGKVSGRIFPGLPV